MRHPVRRLAAASAALLGAVLMMAPAAAQADHQHHRHRHHHERGAIHVRPWLDVHAGWRHLPRLARHPRAHRASFYCERCHHGFERRRAFHRHLHHAHGIPFARLPFVVVHTHFGWVFGR